MKTAKIITWMFCGAMAGLAVEGNSCQELTRLFRLNKKQEESKPSKVYIAYLTGEALRDLRRALETREAELVWAGFLEKDPKRSYTSDDMAEDLGRYVRGETASEGEKKVAALREQEDE